MLNEGTGCQLAKSMKNFISVLIHVCWYMWCRIICNFGCDSEELPVMHPFGIIYSLATGSSLGLTLALVGACSGLWDLSNFFTVGGALQHLQSSLADVKEQLSAPFIWPVLRAFLSFAVHFAFLYRFWLSPDITRNTEPKSFLDTPKAIIRPQSCKFTHFLIIFPVDCHGTLWVL